MTRDSDPKNRDEVPLGFSHHDHRRCESAAMELAEKHCAEAGLHFTAVRRRVLEILLHEHRAIGAYKVLEQLNEDGFGSHPPSAYRALDFLVLNGLAHKIERLNAFIACVRPNLSQTTAFMICRLCKGVAETRSSPAKGNLGHVARATGFRIERTIVEAEGICPACIDNG